MVALWLISRHKAITHQPIALALHRLVPAPPITIPRALRATFRVTLILMRLINLAVLRGRSLIGVRAITLPVAKPKGALCLLGAKRHRQVPRQLATPVQSLPLALWITSFCIG